MGERHHGHGHNSGGCERTEPERGKKNGYRGCRSGSLDTRRRDADRGTKKARGAPTTAAWEAAESEAQTKAEPSTDTNTDAENYIDTDSGDDITPNTDQMKGDTPTTKPIETG